jgi:hypothetical protein
VGGESEEEVNIPRQGKKDLLEILEAKRWREMGGGTMSNI